MPYEYYRQGLSARDRNVYDTILSGWLCLSERISVRHGYGYTPDFDKIVHALHLDHPEVFWVDLFEGVRITTQSYSNVFCITTERSELLFKPFYMKKSEIQDFRKALQTWSRSVISSMPSGLSDSKKYWYIMDYLSRSVSYGELCTRTGHTVLGCIPEGGRTAVCQGIAYGFKFLCDILHLPCITVEGTLADDETKVEENHAWNIILLYGQYRHLDATGEIQFTRSLGHARSGRIILTDEEALKEGYRWRKEQVPACVRITEMA